MIDLIMHSDFEVMTIDECSYRHFSYYCRLRLSNEHTGARGGELFLANIYLINHQD